MIIMIQVQKDVQQITMVLWIIRPPLQKDNTRDLIIQSTKIKRGTLSIVMLVKEILM
uniref:Uncharacterized protein n=2 Tax=Arundo donax TaxID=35708 RepID=A0A0A9G7C3_ARUDO